MAALHQPVVLGAEPPLTHTRSIGCLTAPHIFSPTECRTIIGLGLAEPLTTGLMQTPLEGYRRCRHRFVMEDGDNAWIFQRLQSLVLRVNEQFKFRLANFAEGMQFTKYVDGDVIHWHIDTGTDVASTRKISLSVQLSAPTEYEGGTFEMFPEGEPTFARNQGSVIVFPSYLTHRVTRITNGERYSLVVWAHGPAFS